jgi:hypothetical protein
MAKSNASLVPEFMCQVVADEPAASERAVAEQAVLALNASTMNVYEASLLKFKKNLRDLVPIILGLFTGQGGQFIEREMAKRGKKALLPTQAPFRSNDWPWKTDPTKGTGPARLEDVR